MIVLSVSKSLSDEYQFIIFYFSFLSFNLLCLSFYDPCFGLFVAALLHPKFQKKLVHCLKCRCKQNAQWFVNITNQYFIHKRTSNVESETFYSHKNSSSWIALNCKWQQHLSKHCYSNKKRLEEHLETN